MIVGEADRNAIHFLSTRTPLFCFAFKKRDGEMENYNKTSRTNYMPENKKDNDLPKRKNIRLRGYSYSSGGSVFITICVKDTVLSEIKDRVGESPEVRLTPTGKIVEKYVLSINKAESVYVENHVIMPDHIHLLIYVDNPSGELGKEGIPSNEKIPRVIAGFKRLTNKEIGRNIFQSRYYDHVIRDERDYETKWQYIEDNPANWLEKKNWQEEKK